VETDKREAAGPDEALPEPGWRIKTGFAMFIASMAWPVLMPILLLFGVSTASVAKIAGFLLVVAEVMMLTAAAITGKDGFAYIKKRVFGLVKSYGPPRVVSAMRYKIGLILFTVPLLLALLAPYLGVIVTAPIANSVLLAVAADISLLVGLFLLGGDFWDKLRSLFMHKSVAVMPDPPPAK
jgi:hypothetical protein